MKRKNRTPTFLKRLEEAWSHLTEAPLGWTLESCPITYLYKK